MGSVRARRLFVTLMPTERSRRCDDGCAALGLGDLYYYFEELFSDGLEYAGTFFCHYFLYVVHKILCIELLSIVQHFVFRHYLMNWNDALPTVNGAA